jgi:hypothetical protein
MGAQRRAKPESKGARSLLLGGVGCQPVEHGPWALRVRRFALITGVRPDAIKLLDHDVVSQWVLARSLLACLAQCRSGGQRSRLPGAQCDWPACGQSRSGQGTGG